MAVEALSGNTLFLIEPGGARGKGSVWAPQLHEGLLYLSDIPNGIWAVTPAR